MFQALRIKIAITVFLTITLEADGQDYGRGGNGNNGWGKNPQRTADSCDHNKNHGKERDPGGSRNTHDNENRYWDKGCGGGKEREKKDPDKGDRNRFGSNEIHRNSNRNDKSEVYANGRERERQPNGDNNRESFNNKKQSFNNNDNIITTTEINIQPVTKNESGQNVKQTYVQDYHW